MSLRQWLSRCVLHNAGQREWVGGRGVSRLSGGLSTSIVWFQLTRETWAFKVGLQDETAAVNAMLPVLSAPRITNTTSAQLNPRLALTGRPGQSCDLGGPLSCIVLGITAKLTSCNFRYSAYINEDRI